MIKLVATAILACTTLGVWAQDPSTPPVKRLYKIRIQHADPQLVYLLLKGEAHFGTPPELSTHDQGAIRGK